MSSDLVIAKASIAWLISCETTVPCVMSPFLRAMSTDFLSRVIYLPLDIKPLTLPFLNKSIFFAFSSGLKFSSLDIANSNSFLSLANITSISLSSLAFNNVFDSLPPSLYNEVALACLINKFLERSCHTKFSAFLSLLPL